MNELWFPDVQKVVGKNAGSFVKGYKKKGVFHTTEGKTAAGAIATYRETGSWPHFTFDRNATFTIYQHLPIDLAARALVNASGGVETNRGGAIQLEVVGFAREAGKWPPGQIEAIKKVMRWVEGNADVKPVGPGRPFATAYGQSKIRFTNSEWKNFNGWCGHCHVTENLHWDPGNIDINIFLEVKPMYDPAECFVFVRTDPTKGGWIAVKENGAIFNGESSDYHGGMDGNPNFIGRQAAKIVFPEDNDPRFIPGYKYMIVSRSNEYYGLPI